MNLYDFKKHAKFGHLTINEQTAYKIQRAYGGQKVKIKKNLEKNNFQFFFQQDMDFLPHCSVVLNHCQFFLNYLTNFYLQHLFQLIKVLFLKNSIYRTMITEMLGKICTEIGCWRTLSAWSSDPATRTCWVRKFSLPGGRNFLSHHTGDARFTRHALETAFIWIRQAV